MKLRKCVVLLVSVAMMFLFTLNTYAGNNDIFLKFYSDSFGNRTDTIESVDNIIPGEYSVGVGWCALYQENGEYYIDAPNSQDFLEIGNVNVGYDVSRLKISPEAKIYIATGVDIYSNAYGEDEFNWKYSNLQGFYDVADYLFSNGHWNMNDGIWHFTVMDQDGYKYNLEAYPKAIINEKNEVVLIKEYYTV